MLEQHSRKAGCVCRFDVDGSERAENACRQTLIQGEEVGNGQTTPESQVYIAPFLLCRIVDFWFSHEIILKVQIILWTC